MSEERISQLNDLVNEVTLDVINVEKVKALLETLQIEYSEDPMQLLNNILKGIHTEEGHSHESEI